MAEPTIRLRDRQREITLRLPAETCVSILASVREDMDTIDLLLDHANHYDATVRPAIARDEPDATGELASRAAAFEVDLVAKRIAFPGDVIDFGRRGVLTHRTEDGALDATDYRTYVVGRGFTLYDTSRRMEIDEKAALRNEKSLWSSALPPVIPDERIPYRLDGMDLAPENLQELRLWTLSDTPTAPTVEGMAVYSLRREGPGVESQRGAQQGAPTGPGQPPTGGAFTR